MMLIAKREKDGEEIQHIRLANANSTGGNVDRMNIAS